MNGLDLTLAAGLAIPVGYLLLTGRPRGAALYGALYTAAGLAVFAAAVAAIRAA